MNGFSGFLSLILLETMVLILGIIWICKGWHICFNCGQRSHFQCLCCPISVCHDCLGKVGLFVELGMQQNGFCTSCLNKAILIEKNADPDPRWVSECIYLNLFCMTNELTLVNSAKNFTMHVVILQCNNLCCISRKDTKVVYNS